MAKLLVYFALAAISLQAISASAIPTKHTTNSGTNGRLSGSEKLDDLYEVSWAINEQEKIISFEVKAETKGWVGLGISPNGGMLGADLFIGGVYENGTTYGSDYHGIGNTKPVEDTSIDWTLDEAHEDDTHTYISFHRKLDTCDLENDMQITDETMRIIWAIGVLDTDIGYHGAARGVKSVNFYLGSEDDFPVDDFEPIDITVETEMPAEHTTYWCTIHELPELTQKRHVVAFEAILDNPDALEHTHHFLFHRCIAPEGQDPETFFKPWTTHAGEHCYGKKENEEFPFDQYCSGNLIYTWSKGGKRMVFPEDIGYPIPENVGVKEYYALEVHYDNPQNQAGKKFKTGGRIYHTDKLRDIEAGVMVVQHNTRVQLTVPPKTEDFVVAGHCSGECTQNMLPETGITAFNVMLHAHLTGRKIKLRHFRGEQELEWVSKDDFYDFDFQQSKTLNKPKKIERGDQLTLECNYNTMGVKDDMAVIGGLSSHEEMCQAWVFYWPRLDMKVCGSYQDLDKHFELLGFTQVKKVEASVPGGVEEYEVVKPDGLAGPYLESVSKKIDWTTEFRAKYQQEKRFGEQIPVCSGGLKRQVKLALPVKYPENLKEYVAPTECPAVTDPPSETTTAQGEETSTAENGNSTPSAGTTSNDETTSNTGSTQDSGSTQDGGVTSPESTESTTESSGDAVKITSVLLFFSVFSLFML